MMVAWQQLVVGLVPMQDSKNLSLVPSVIAKQPLFHSRAGFLTLL